MTNEGRPANELAAERAVLLDAFDAIDDAAALWEFQQRLIAEIVATEPVAFADRGSPERRHLKLLRLFGDALAWSYLHSYTIRQLAKNPAPPPALHNQLGFPATCNIAQTLCQEGYTALVADLTFCLRISDVIVCKDPEHPILIESGGNPNYATRGRKGRQQRRASAVTDLLNSGEAVLEGDSHPTATLSIATTATHTFDAIAVAMKGQAQDGAGWAQSGEADVVIALDARDEDLDFPEAAHTVIGAMGRPAIGVHLRLLERPSAMLSPPHVWPLSREHRTSLIEGDVVLVHMVDLDAFVGPSAQGPGVLTTVRTSKDQVLGYVVDVDDKSAHVSSRFMDDVLFGFQTIEATRDQIIEGVVAQYHRAADGRSETSLRVDSLEELTEVLSKVEAGTATMPDWLSFPGELSAVLTAWHKIMLGIDAPDAARPTSKERP